MGASLLSSTLQYSCKNVVSKPRRVLSAPTPPVQLQHIRNPLQRLEFHSLHHTGAPRLRVSTVSQVPATPAPKDDSGSEDRPRCISTGKILLRGLAMAGVLLALKFAVPAAVVAAEQAAGSSGLVGLLKGMVEFILHLDEKLGAIIAQHGTTTYAILFAIVFCETGLVLTPFLPGDSLLFAAGAFAGLKKLSIFYLLATFISSAILGDAANYAIGSWLGEKAIDSGVVSKKAINKTEKFYEKYGGKTIVLARFVPIVRTFAPFVAGISKMAYRKFAAYNVFGAIVWTLLFCGVGFFFGNLPFVEKNFSAVVLGIVAVSVLPVVFEIIAARREEAGGDKNDPPVKTQTA